MTATQTQRIPLAKARTWAERIKEELKPFCDLIEIAGSIRRKRPDVGDIDIVCLPKREQFHALRERAKQSTKVIKDGESTLILELANGFQLDLWIAAPAKKELFSSTPTNFGSLLLCRTGSIAHNIHLVNCAKRLGLTWNPYFGVFDQQGRPIASENERMIFDALQVEFVEPEKRER